MEDRQILTQLLNGFHLEAKELKRARVLVDEFVRELDSRELEIITDDELKIKQQK